MGQDVNKVEIARGSFTLSFMVKGARQNCQQPFIREEKKRKSLDVNIKQMFLTEKKIRLSKW